MYDNRGKVKYTYIGNINIMMLTEMFQRVMHAGNVPVKKRI